MRKLLNVQTEIHRLSDRFGEYVIHVRCRKCGHSRTINPRALAQIAGWNAELREVSERLRCSVCQARMASYSVEVNVPSWRQRWGTETER